MGTHENERNILFIYELGHIDACVRFLDGNPEVREEGYLLVALGPELEYALAKKGIPFRSGRAYCPLDAHRFPLVAEEWTKLFDSPERHWFQYRNVSLSRLFFFTVRHYTAHLLYYATLAENLLKQHPAARRLIVFPSLQSPTISPGDAAFVRQQPLLRRYLDATVVCARLIGAERGVAVLVPQAPLRPKRRHLMRSLFVLRRALLELAIRLYNASIALLRPRGTPRILASDYWRNIEPIMSQLPRGELMLFDRGEMLRAGISNLWRSRIRLFNFNSFSIRARRRDRAEAQRLFEEQWCSLRENGLPEYSFGTFSLRPLMAEAFEELFVRVVPQTLRDIDGAYALYENLAPEVVFLRASVSLQTHFSILALVARACGIPSLELQHGLEYLGPDSIGTRHSAEYFAVYGQVVQDEFAALGLQREKFPVIGSPRFDAYKKESSTTHRAPHPRKGISVLCVGSVSAQNEYDLEDYYSTIARALEKVPGSSVVIKLRHGRARESYYREIIETLFARVPHTIAQYEPLSELLASADVVVSYFSTFVLEALQFSKPTIVFNVESFEKEMIRFHFTRYAEAGSLLLAFTQEELETALRSLSGDGALRTRVAERAEKVLAQLYSFDGRASERMIELITRLARKRYGTH